MKRIVLVLLTVMICICPVNTSAFAEESADASAAPEIHYPARLYIDNENTYNGMESSYSNGYVPTVKSGVAKLVLPILCDGELKDNKIRATVNLGSPDNMPFVSKNYEKTVRLAKHKINGKDSISAYLVAFDLKLSSQRINGVYPVMLDISAIDKTGNTVSEQFTLYVTITDGEKPQASEDNKVKPVLAPKILVVACKAVAVDETGAELAHDRITAGQRIRLTVTLRNMSSDVGVINMTVNITAPDGYFTLRNASRDTYIESIPAAESFEVVYEYDTSISAPAEEHGFAVIYDYNYMQGESYLASSGNGTATVRLAQEVKVQFDKVMLPSELTVSDTVNTTVSAMNIGRCIAYNVRAVIEADGLSPSGTAFIGNINAGQAGSASVNVYVSSLKESETMYGNTKGKITFYYEDADGNEYSEESEFQTMIKSPFTVSDIAPKDSPSQWWIIVGISAAAISACIIGLAVAYGRKRKKYGKDN